MSHLLGPKYVLTIFKAKISCGGDDGGGVGSDGGKMSGDTVLCRSWLQKFEAKESVAAIQLCEEGKWWEILGVDSFYSQWMIEFALHVEKDSGDRRLRERSHT